MNGDSVTKRQQAALFPSVSTYYQKPLVLDRAEGRRIWAEDGTEYLDFFGGILTVSVGHAHSEIVERTAQQMRRLGHISTLYIQKPQVELAERLGELAPGDVGRAYFTNSGTEANEVAILTAQLYTGQQEVIALRHSYSGRSPLAMSLTGNHGWRISGSQVAGIKHAASPYCYRCPFGKTYPECNIICARDLEELIQTTTSGSVAAFIAEPIQGVGGFITPPPEYFEIAVDIVRRHGGVFICDEVQTGFGRTGSTWFGIEHWGVTPDIITCAKGLANGFPIGATLSTPEIAEAWRGAGSTISTFGGNAVASTAALATLDVMAAEALPGNAQRMGERLRAGLEDLKECYPVMGDVRGMGLMQGIELVSEDGQPAPAALDALMEATRKQGLLIGKGGLYGNVVRIAPPMSVTAAEVDEALEKLGDALASITD